MNRTISLLACALTVVAAGLSRPASHTKALFRQDLELAVAPNTITVDGKRLLTAKAALAVGEPSTTKALISLLKDADGWLNHGPWTVMSKNGTAPTGDKHDFMVQNAYFWPSPGSPDGCPYVPRDGVANPDVSMTDDLGLRRTLESSWILALAWYYTGNEAYAKHASLILKTWFLEEDTRMNPNTDYGSWLPCMEPEDNPYSFAALIGLSARISFAIDAIRILESTQAPGWSAQDTSRMQSWCRGMIEWLLESPVGSQTLLGFNNYGLYAHLAGINMGMYIGDNHLARQLLHNVTYRIDDGITANGSQPHELIRTQAFHYSMFTLVGYTRIISMGEKLCVDLWQHVGPEGQTVEKGIEFLIPAALNGTDVWPYPENIHFRRAAPNNLFHFAAERGNQMALDALTSCRLQEPSLGDRWPIRPAPQELESSSILEPSD